MLANGGEFNGKRIFSRRWRKPPGSAQVPKGVAIAPRTQLWARRGVLTDGPATGTPPAHNGQLWLER